MIFLSVLFHKNGPRLAEAPGAFQSARASFCCIAISFGTMDIRGGMRSAYTTKRTFHYYRNAESPLCGPESEKYYVITNSSCAIRREITVLGLSSHRQ